ncbi:MAG TPA: Flp pilus assembly protein CpaB [Tepidisphaeraceae bacterium]|jgi:pilus assembly protein CpaB|nr:Flp pilus assembly protein CpaB [Tepidisphaeraceae bacterium]
MNIKTIVPLAAAVVLGLIAAMIAKSSMSKPGPDASAQAKTTIVTLKRDLTAGQEIAMEDVTATSLSSPVAPPGTFVDVTEVIGRVTIAPMVVGQPVLSPLLAPKGAVGGLQALVPMGMRAITIDVTETTGVGGLIVPGCLVDVLITLNGDASGGPLTKTLVQGVKVQAVGQRMGPAPKDAPADAFRSATLLVTPTQAETIELASTAGRPRLVLRSNNDTADSNTSGVTLTELRGTRRSNTDDVAVTQQVMNTAPSTQPVAVAPVEAVAPRREPSRRIVKIIKGGVQSTVTFESNRGEGMVVSSDDMFAD